MLASVALLCIFVKLLDRSGGGGDPEKLNGGYKSRKQFLDEVWSKNDVITEGGKLIKFTTRTDMEVGDLFLYFVPI